MCARNRLSTRPRRRRPDDVVLRRRRGRGDAGPPEPVHGGASGHQRELRERALPDHPGAAADPARGRTGPGHRPRHQHQGTGAALARPYALPREPGVLPRELRRPARLDAAGRIGHHPRLHDPAHPRRRLRQQDAVRAGGRRDAGRGRHLGRVGRGSDQGRREPAAAGRLRHRPLGSPHHRPEHLLRRHLLGRGRYARADRGGHQAVRRKARRLDRERPAPARGLGQRRRHHVPRRRRRLHQRAAAVLLLGQLAGGEPLDQDRRRLRLGRHGLALR